MVINGIDTIKDDGGDYLVLVDYGCENILVAQQCATLEESLTAIAREDYGPRCLVRLVRFDVTEPPETP